MKNSLVNNDDNISLASAINNSTLPIADVQTDHTFLDGMYMRRASAKAGTLVVGAIHKKSCYSMLIKGKIRQVDGDKEYEIEAPAVIVTEAGSSRSAFVLEDCVYVTITRAESTNVEDVEKELYENKPYHSQIASDYNSLLEELDLTEAQVQEQVNIDNVIETERDSYEKKPSDIHGVGVFAKKDIYAGDLIGDGTLDGKYRTTLGRWTNHSPSNNAQGFFKPDGNIAMYATRDILEGTEILLNYRDTLFEDRRQLCQVS